MFVLPGHGAKLVPNPTPEQLAPFSDTERGLLLEHFARLQASLDESVYPCRECNPPAFYRWARGCLAPDHDPATCERCTAAMGRAGAHRASQARGRPAPEPAPAAYRPDRYRRDLE